MNLALRAVFFPQISIIGSSMGSHEEFMEMLQFIELHEIRPVIDRVYPLSDIGLAFEQMEQGEQYGNIGISIG
jgi:zinc-binding alcohol dehydrogenase/oxidoreductase